MRRRDYLGLLVAALALTMAVNSSVAVARTFSEHPGNLLVNPGAEAAGEEIPGWSGTTGYATTAYGAAGEYPGIAISESMGQPGENGGARFFDPGTASAAKLTQVVSVASYATAIDAYEKTIDFGGWFGGYASSPDTVEMLVTPLDGSGEPLAPPWTLKGPTAAQRDDRTALVDVGYKQTLGEEGVTQADEVRPPPLMIPPLTRSLRVELVATENQPGESKNHGYADELSVSVGQALMPGEEIMALPGDPSAPLETGGVESVVPGSPQGADRPPSLRAGKHMVIEWHHGRALLDTRIVAGCPSGGGACRAVATAVSVSTTVHRTPVVLGHAQLTIKNGGKADLLVRLSNAAARMLQRHRHLRIRIEVAARQGEGTIVHATRAVDL